MNSQILLVLGILTVLLVSGCTGSAITKSVENTVVCTPEWIKLQSSEIAFVRLNYTTMQYEKAKATQDMQDSCKGSCYKEYKVVKFKLENTQDLGIELMADCFCDVNNC